MPAWMTSLLRALVAVPMAASASRISTSRPASASARANASPTTPAPTTTQSTRSIASPPSLACGQACLGSGGEPRGGGPECKSPPRRRACEYPAGAGESGLAGDDQVLLHQFFLALDVVFIEGDAVHRADLLALGFVVVADAFGAQVGVDDVDLLALGDGAVGAF